MGEQENKINIKKSTLKCYECGNRLMADDDCRYFCENCGLEFENEYSLVRAYLKKNGSTEALKVSGATGVAMSKLNHYLRKGMVEVADNSKTFITCKKCGAEIKYGEYCPGCAKMLNPLTQPDIKEEIDVGELAHMRKTSGNGMHYLDKHSNAMKRK